MLFNSDGSVDFENQDMSFVQKFGFFEATDMVLDFKAHSNLPFIYDTHQLAHFFGISRENLFKTVRGCDKYYRDIAIKKKNGKDRLLQVPCSHLKSMQSTILHRILDKVTVSDYATAYKKGARLAKNAKPHTNKKYLLKMDITDFFGSITFLQVYSAAFNTHCFPKQIGVMLTTLCTKNECLPQGAPTSPALSNIVMKSFDENLGAWCKARGIAYTRYCDDLTFSSDKPLFSVYQRAKDMLEQMGFEINERKTHFITNANRQSITGLIVNEKVAVSREYKRALRQEIYYGLKYGFAESIVNYDKFEFIENCKPKTEQYFNHLMGRLNFVLQIEPNNKWFIDAYFKMKQYQNKRRRFL